MDTNPGVNIYNAILKLERHKRDTGNLIDYLNALIQKKAGDD